MRVVGGSKKGHKLYRPPQDVARPTADRVKESVFAILSDLVWQADVLDLFAGSGSLGIEALSRGAARAVFVEQHPRAGQCIKRNLSKTNLHKEADLWPLSVQVALRRLAAQKRQFHLVFMDPPYGLDLIDETLWQLLKGDLLKKDALVVVEHTCKEEVATDVAKLVCIREVKYGDSVVTFLKNEEGLE